MKEVRWGVIGLGEHATKRMIPAMGEVDGARLSCVCTSSEEKASALKEQNPDVECFHSIDEFLAKEDLDAVYIATPHHLHVPHAFQAINAGKHVLVEKPLSMSVDGAKKLVEAAKKREKILGVGYQLRQHAGLLSLKQMVQEGELGDVEMVLVNIHHPITIEPGWKRETIHAGPTSLMHLGVHAIDLILWLKNAGASEVVTSAVADENQDGIINSVSMIVNFRDGTQGIVSVSCRMQGTVNQLAVIGSKAQVCADLEWPPSLKIQTLTIKTPEGEEKKEFRVENLFRKELDIFSRAVSEGTEFSPGGEENMPVVELTCAVIESINSRRAVKVGEVQRVSG